MQLGYQLADSISGGAYSFAGTCLILGALDFLGKFVPVLRLRVSDEDEVLGLDDVEIGEFAVGHRFLLPPFLLLSALPCIPSYKSRITTLTMNVQYDYVELTREVASPDDVDEGLSTHSLEQHASTMGMHEKNQESVDSSHQLAEWAHRA
jgi:Amt family ammonium transporter